MMKEEEERELKLKEARKKKKLKTKVEGDGSASPDGRSDSQSPINLKLSNISASAKSKPRYSIKPKEPPIIENVLGDSEEGSGRKEINLEEVEVTNTKKRFKLTGHCSVKLDESNTYKVPNELIRNRIKSEPLGWMNYLDIEKIAME